MFNLLNQKLIIIILCILGSLILYRYYGKLVNIILKKLNVKKTGLQLMLARIFVIILNLFLLILFQINLKELFSLQNQQTGLVMISIGLAFGVLVSIFTYRLIRESKAGENYRKIVEEAPGFTFFTLLLFVGPAEDILFIGIIQYALMEQFGWVAIILHLIIFNLYHYINVLNGAESKKEFFGMLPLRMIISLIHALTFYLTHTLIYGIIMHNLFDTFIFIAVYIAIKKKKKLC